MHRLLLLLCIAASRAAAARLSVQPRASKRHVPNSTALGTPHHIYRANTTAAEAWDPCSAAAFPPCHWVAPVSGSGGRQGSQLHGTLEAQRFIWAHQHPADCTQARFLLYHSYASGIGSALHHMGQALALAIQLDRVMVVAFEGKYVYHDVARCGEGTPWEACYFEPLSSCSWRDAAADGANPACISSPSQVGQPPPKTVCFAGSFTAPDYHLQTVPPQFSKLLEATPIDPKKRFYWWRAQSVAYIVRPNARTRAEIGARRRGAFAGRTIVPGTISVHVRHGDKHRESPPMPDELYLQRAKEMLAEQRRKNGSACAAAAAGPGCLNRRLFVSTEDPATVAFFANVSGWDAAATDVPRKPDPYKATLSYVAEFGPYKEVLNSLLNLELALQADAYIGTLSSNWCRLIDELRSTVRCKAHARYLDAEQPNPPQGLDW